MKLYAKLHSDRASKGQGGNRFINIELIMENKKSFAWFEFFVDKNQDYVLRDEDGNELRRIAKDGTYNPLRKVEPSATYKCSECDFETEWTMSDIAKKGEPVCPKCNCDMKQVESKCEGENCDGNCEFACFTKKAKKQKTS